MKTLRRFSDEKRGAIIDDGLNTQAVYQINTPANFCRSSASYPVERIVPLLWKIKRITNDTN